MNKRIWLSLVLMLVWQYVGRADEGMWLMQQLRSQYGKMRERGLKLQEYDLYNDRGTALKDAVVIFGRGCTGEVISSQGLVLTNHHCGYDAIQSLSSVEHNYLEDGFWAQRNEDELPAEGLKITFIDKIEDVTSFVKKALKSSPKGSMDYLSPKFLAGLVAKRFPTLPYGTEVEIKAFYNGNRYLMFTKRIYSDIRFVGAPPSSIGKFGADTDNWAYPRHTGDFSIFRIYADAEGNPAPYSITNQPLRPKRWLNISTQGVEEGQFAMVMGFPGRTNRFFLPEEVAEWQHIDNDIRIRMRAIRQETMLREMLTSAKTNIQYAAKYAYSQNGYKRAIGANWGIKVRRLDEDKRQQMQSLLNWAKPKDRKRYEAAIADIRTALGEREGLRRRMWYILEGFVYGMDLMQLPKLAGQDAKAQEAFYKDFDPEVERKVATALLSEYVRAVPEAERPEALNSLLALQGSPEGLIKQLTSGKYMSLEGLKSLSSNHTTANKEAGDVALELFVQTMQDEYKRLQEAVAAFDSRVDKARQAYVEGLLAQHGDEHLWPDANSTLRFTYGNIKGYKPRDGVYYAPQTYLDGVMAKADSTSWEFAVPQRLREIYQKQSYGKDNRWAVRDAEGKWRMPVNFCATTHTTGGNSGSPVLNAEGNLIGINFDRNWEGVGGDIQYLADYQRSIICDIRYILMIIEEYGRCPRLIEEMSFAK